MESAERALDLVAEKAGDLFGALSFLGFVRTRELFGRATKQIDTAAAEIEATVTARGDDDGSQSHSQIEDFSPCVVYVSLSGIHIRTGASVCVDVETGEVKLVPSDEGAGQAPICFSFADISGWEIEEVFPNLFVFDVLEEQEIHLLFKHADGPLAILDAVERHARVFDALRADGSLDTHAHRDVRDRGAGDISVGCGDAGGLGDIDEIDDVGVFAAAGGAGGQERVGEGKLEEEEEGEQLGKGQVEDEVGQKVDHLCAPRATAMSATVEHKRTRSGSMMKLAKVAKLRAARRASRPGSKGAFETEEEVETEVAAAVSVDVTASTITAQRHRRQSSLEKLALLRAKKVERDRRLKS